MVLMTRYKAVQICLEELGINGRFNKPQKVSNMFMKLDNFYGKFQASFSSKKLEEEKRELDDHLERYADFISVYVRPGKDRGKEDELWIREYKSYILGIYLETVDIILVGSYLLSNNLISFKELEDELICVKNKLIKYNVDMYLNYETVDHTGKLPLLRYLIKYKTYELVTAIDSAYKTRNQIKNIDKLIRYRNMFTVLYPEKDIQYLKNLKLIRKFVFCDMFDELLLHIGL